VGKKEKVKEKGDDEKGVKKKGNLPKGKGEESEKKQQLR